MAIRKPLKSKRAPARDVRLSEPVGRAAASDLQDMLSDKLTSQIGFQLRIAQIAVYRAFTEMLAPLKLRPIHYAAMVVIEDNPGLKQQEASGALGVRNPNMVVLIRELEVRKFVVRRAVPGDARSYALHLSPQGYAALKQMNALRIALDRKITTALGGSPDRLLAELKRLAQI